MKENSNQTVGLSYGVISDPLSKQLNKQKLKYDKKKMNIFQNELNAIHTLRFNSNLLTDSMADKLIQKLHKKIIIHLAKENGKSVKK